MRKFPLWLCIVTLLLLIAPVSATLGQRAKPPGIVTADQQSNQTVEPPMEMHGRKMNVDQVKQEADELKKLADGVPAQIEQVTKNQYPKDLADNLKRIERLAKHLRTEVTP
jgi:gas vesicle protein